MESDLPNHRAFGIQQPWAELILRGIKSLEIRTLTVRSGGPFYLYASKQPARSAFALEAATRHGLDLENLPRGVLVGTYHYLMVAHEESHIALLLEAMAAVLPEIDRVIEDGKLAEEADVPRGQRGFARLA